MSKQSMRHLAVALESQLHLHSVHIDLANRGRYRSTYALDEVFFQLLGLLRPTLFVEAGAFDAQASLRAATDLPGTRAVAFEANPTNYERWTQAVDFSAQGVEYEHLALASTPGEITFHLRGHDAEGSDADFEDNSLLPRSSDLGRSTTTVSVPATTLDAHFPDLSYRAALWMDVEGANREVIGGGRGFLTRCDLAKVEVESSPMWENQWLAVDVIEAFLTTGMIPVARDVQAETQYNIVFVRDEALRSPEVQGAIDVFLRAQLRSELPGVLGQARRNPLARRTARGIRTWGPTTRT